MFKIAHFLQFLAGEEGAALRSKTTSKSPSSQWLARVVLLQPYAALKRSEQPSMLAGEGPI